MLETYILLDGVPVPEPDIFAWGKWMETFGNRRVALWEYSGIQVSTVFLGIDHNFHNDGDPVLFETMVFGGGSDQAQARYTDLQSAIEGHNHIVQEVRKLFNLPVVKELKDFSTN